MNLGDNLVEQVCTLSRKALDLLAKMEGESDYRGSIVALREARECIGTQADLLTRAHKMDASNFPPEIQVTIVDVSQ